MKFYLFSDSAYQTQLEQHQCHIKLDENFADQNAHGHLTYVIKNRNWIPHIGKTNLSNCNFKKIGILRKDDLWLEDPIQFQLTCDLKDDTILYQRIHLPWKKDQGDCEPTSRNQATIACFPDDTFTTFQLAKNHARLISFHKIDYKESVTFD